MKLKNREILALMGLFFLGAPQQCNAMDYVDAKIQGPQGGSSIRRLIKPLIVAFLALSNPQGVQGLALANDVQVADTVRGDTSWQMASIYFNATGNCSPRCVATADPLGPLEAVCTDYIGCENMYMEGAYRCYVDPEEVGEYNCTIARTSRIRTSQSKDAKHTRLQAKKR